jgi:fumarate hydratase subunit alpha
VIYIREVSVLQIKDVIKRLFFEANCFLDNDVLFTLEKKRFEEKSGIGREVIENLIENAAISKHEEIPMCQDTGFAVIFIKIGQEVHIVDGILAEYINLGVREGYKDLRKSMVNDPLVRINTGDNTPAIIHTDIVPGDKISITVAPKGGGSENMSALKMLKPSEGKTGIMRFVVDTVKNAASNPCPPIVVGVGIGGTMEKAAIIAKHALTRPLGSVNEDKETSELEQELLLKINNLGIGPQGFGGSTTALGVHIERFPTHIACLPVAVNISCHAYRHKTIVI